MSKASEYESANLADHDHINEIGESIAAMATRNQMDARDYIRELQRLGHIIRLHFTIEENEMTDMSYPDWHSHKMSHAFILGELNFTIECIKADIKAASPSLWLHLASKLRAHKAKYDDALAEFIAQAPIPAVFEDVDALLWVAPPTRSPGHHGPA